jgi:hypothetical protein
VALALTVPCAWTFDAANPAAKARAKRMEINTVFIFMTFLAEFRSAFEEPPKAVPHDRATVNDRLKCATKKKPLFAARPWYIVTPLSRFGG